MKRVITILILIIISFLLQTTVLSFHNASGYSPNLLMIITMSFGIMRGRREGLLTGFASGFLMDVFFSDIMGIYMLIFMTIGYINGFFHKNFVLENAFLPVCIITADEIVFNTIIYLAMYLLRNRTDFMYYFINIILPETILTVIATIIIYRFYVFVNRRLKNSVNKKR